MHWMSDSHLQADEARRRCHFREVPGAALPGFRFMPRKDAPCALGRLKQHFAPEHRDATAADTRVTATLSAPRRYLKQARPSHLDALCNGEGGLVSTIEREQQSAERGAGASRRRIFPCACERCEHPCSDRVAIARIEEQRQASRQLSMQPHELAKSGEIRRRSGKSFRLDLCQHEVDADRGLHWLVGGCSDIVT